MHSTNMNAVCALALASIIPRRCHTTKGKCGAWVRLWLKCITDSPQRGNLFVVVILCTDAVRTDRCVAKAAPHNRFITATAALYKIRFLSFRLRNVSVYYSLTRNNTERRLFWSCEKRPIPMNNSSVTFRSCRL